MDMNDVSFRETLAQEYRIVEMYKDNNCLFCALALRFKGDRRHQMTVREEVWTFIKNNEEIFKDVLAAGETKVEYETMRENESWGGELALAAAAILFDCTIVVIQQNFNQTEYNMLNGIRSDNPLFLSYHNRDHYNYLEKREDKLFDDAMQVDEPSLLTSEDFDMEQYLSEEDIESSTLNSQSYAATLSDEQLGMKYLTSTTEKRGRDEFATAILVYGKFTEYATLEELFNKKKPRKICFVPLYYLQQLRMLQTDIDVGQDFTLFIRKKTLPLDEEMHDREKLLANILIVPLLLTAVGFKWDDIEIETFCRWGHKSMAANLLNKAWGKIGNAVLDDVDLIINNTNVFFCKGCDKYCQYLHKPWHSDIRDYCREDFLEFETGLFTPLFRFFKMQRHPTPVFSMIQEIKAASGSSVEKLALLTEGLEQNRVACEGQWFSSYLVLHLDGPAMPTTGDVDVMKLILDRKVMKSVYAGSTTNERFRTTHFRNIPTSSLYDVLTKTSKLFFIRQLTFKTHAEAREDEAIVIELLKNYLKWKMDFENSRPFYLLNKVSEVRRLLTVTHDDKAQILKFCGSGFPIFRTDNTNDDKFDWGRFQGNYLVNEQIEMRPGNYTLREFNDEEVKIAYKALKISSNK